MIVSDDTVVRQQADEDLRLYGSRPEPSDIGVVDDEIQLANLPPKRSASEFETAVRRPNKIHKTDDGANLSFQAVTAMDWHSGASPLESWLNQSALPSITPITSERQEQVSINDLVAQEVKEINVFRSVHMSIAPKGPSPKFDLARDEDVGTLRLGTQIFYRNIRDKYPLIPAYLARRLAEANLNRAERLQRKRFARVGESVGAGESTGNGATNDKCQLALCTNTGGQFSMNNHTATIRPTNDQRATAATCKVCRIRKVQPEADVSRC